MIFYGRIKGNYKSYFSFWIKKNNSWICSFFQCCTIERVLVHCILHTASNNVVLSVLPFPLNFRSPQCCTVCCMWSVIYFPSWALFTTTLHFLQQDICTLVVIENQINITVCLYLKAITYIVFFSSLKC